MKPKRENKWLWLISIFVAMCTVLLTNPVLAGGGMNGGGGGGCG